MPGDGIHRIDLTDSGALHTTARYLALIGVRELPPSTSPFDPGYDLGTLCGHLDQSSHLMASMKISMACWMLADERVIRDKVRAVAEHGVQSVSGGGPFEIAVVQGRLPEYLDLCAAIGFGRIEAGQGFTSTSLDPDTIVTMARERGLQVQYELGGKHSGSFDAEETSRLIALGRSWLEAGAVELVVEARESAAGVGLFGADGAFNGALADRFVEAFSLERLMFEAPTKASQFGLVDHFGPEVRLCNVRLEELLRVEIYRHGLHSDAFGNPRLAPRALLSTIPASRPG